MGALHLHTVRLADQIDILFDLVTLTARKVSSV